MRFAAIAVLLLCPQDGPDPARVSPDRLESTLRRVCAQSRLAGSEESRAAADYAAEVFAKSGLRVSRHRYEVHLPRQTGQSLTLVDADGQERELVLREQGYEEDPLSLRAHAPPMHGLTFAGSAAGRVVYAGYGTRQEFQALKRRMRKGLRGTIALVRYGGLYRGLKVANAEEAGCSGALLYTDPQDDGYFKGTPLPEGPWRPETGIQRGSVYNADGDPLTPGWPALPGSRRIAVEDARGLVGIPSLPISWSNARRFFPEGRRPKEPTPLELSARLEVLQDDSPVVIENVVGWLDGRTHPDEWVVLGGHRDAWGLGAVDNGTGTTVLLEVARVLGAARRQGWQPDRTLVFATWDAEEWGLVGSTEWVEEHLAELRAGGVAYMNMDSVASGPNFGASCTPGLTAVLREQCRAESISEPPNLGTPGGGSDHVPFMELAGMEVLSFGFSGGQGAYHSALDTPFLVERHLDPGFEHHAHAARLAVRLMASLGDRETRLDGLRQWVSQAAASVRALPLPAEQARELESATTELVRAVARYGENASAPHEFLRAFLPPDASERLLLWRTNGYGFDWFPEVAAALEADADPDPAVDRAAAALRAAADSLNPSLQDAGR